jgi:hypothetical protein
MSLALDNIRQDLLALGESARDFVGESLYGSLGIQSNDFMNSFTLFLTVLGAAFVVFRLCSPAPHARYRRDTYGIEFGRNR